jgi:iron complex outermembrane receptor protein
VKKVLMFALMSSAAMVVQPANAQQANVSEEQGSDIVVTAQRRSERLQDVPVSVQAVTADALQAAGVNDQRQLALVAPSLQVQQDNNYAVRGVGTQSFANTIESSVATAIDDVTLGSRVLNGNPFLDLAQVEVLNGPQGLLFGKNASAGLVNITTKRPELGVYGGSFDAEGVSRARPGSDGKGIVARGTINVPFGANVALRVNGIYRYDEPVVRNIRENAYGRFDENFRQYGGRAKLLIEPNDQLSIYLLGEYFEQRGVGTIFDSSFRSLAPNSISESYLNDAGIVAGPHNLDMLTDAPQYRDLNTGGAQANVSYEFDNGWTLSNVFAWKAYSLDQQVDGDTVSADGANVNVQHAKYDQYSNELRLALPSDNPLTGQVGLYYFKSTLDQQSQIAGNNLFPSFLLPSFPFCVGAAVSQPSPPGCSVSNSYFLGQDKDYRLDNQSYAAFGQFTYAVTDKLKLIAGARITRDKVSIDLKQNFDNYFVVLGVPTSSYDQSFSATTFSYRAGAQYNFNRDVMVYATYGRGWKGPGMNDTGASLDADLRVLPERADTAEVGIKSTLFDRLLTFNASLFHTKFSNLQAQTFDTDLRAFVIGNAGKATSKGAEANLVLRPFKHFSVTGNVAYVDAKYDSFVGAQCYPGQQTIFASCAVDGTFDASGNRLTFAPKLTSTISAAYEVPVSDASSLTFDVGYYHRSSIETIVSAPPGSKIEGIDILNASIGLRSGPFTAALFCKNCTNKVYALQTGIEAGDSNAGNLTIYQRMGIDSVRAIGLRFGFTY